jgi:hypothetical protein
MCLTSKFSTGIINTEIITSREEKEQNCLHGYNILMSSRIASETIESDPSCTRFTCGISWNLRFQALQENTKILPQPQDPRRDRRDNDCHSQIIRNMPEPKRIRKVYLDHIPCPLEISLSLSLSLCLSLSGNFRVRITSDTSNYLQRIS